ncbi:potassium channel family protein [Haloplanus aerogenes]|uniref:Trk K+ transport system NAD-binding subunit n=1 Tax=Haloplanus aerogenes TaxID=660522 RepID=A0A3M0CXD4_9EURY|nr:NAD-binding protein [Haloplanus aerogenes]AZH25168.1 TrkA family potassium uptake protein [Haloplanus aerogenes]RMB13604.1 Trk K+ transport system NAD-binding subunit [Haloplanus aerogenes]
MDTWQRRTLQYVVVLTGVMFGYAAVYDTGMSAFEGEAISYLHALQVVVETFTTTGFGSDAPWTSAEMNVLVIVMDLTGVVLIFLALPVLVFPLFEQAISTTVPTTASEDMENHVVICTLTPRGETLVEELDSWGVEHLILEPDRERAKDLYEDGYTVIHADPESVDGMEAARLPEARCLVADDSDPVNTSIVLTAKEVAEDVRTVSVVDDPERERYHWLAGTDDVLSPRSLLGEGLASKVTTGISAELGEAIEIGEDFEVAELPIQRGSDLVGRTIAESGIRERAGVNIIGAWFRGDFESPPSPDATLDNGTVLLVTGHEAQLERLKEMTTSDVRRFRRGRTVVVGHGEVGTTVTNALSTAGVSNVVMDLVEEPGVDVVGDATDPDALARTGIEDARTAILAIPDDTLTEFAILVIRDLNPSIELIARAEETENVQKMYRAGADYVLSLATVSGRMLASSILEDEEVISLDKQVDVVRTHAPGLVGWTLGEANVRARTGCTVVGVDRDGEVITDLGAEFRIREGDELIVAGTDEGTNRFTEMMGSGSD